jgi:hypothetical protein
VADELWTIEVDKIPATRPTYGLEVIWMSRNEKPSPINLNASPIMSILRKKQYKERMSMVRRRVLFFMGEGAQLYLKVF